MKLNADRIKGVFALLAAAAIPALGALLLCYLIKLGERPSAARCGVCECVKRAKEVER